MGGDPALFERALATLEALAPREAEWMAVVPGARWATKRWPLERWASLCRKWIESDPSRHALALLGPGEGAGRAAFETAGPDAPRRIHALTAEFGLVAEILRRMDVVVAGDTGLMHLATAVGAPVVALFGPTTPAFGMSPYGPRHRTVSMELPCRPCSLHGGDVCPLGHHRCMEELDVERVWAAVGGIDLIGAERKEG